MKSELRPTKYFIRCLTLAILCTTLKSLTPPIHSVILSRVVVDYDPLTCQQHRSALIHRLFSDRFYRSIFFHDGLIYTSADVFISAVICNHYRLMIGVRCNEYEPSTRQLVYCMNERQALHETWTSRA